MEDKVFWDGYRLTKEDRQLVFDWLKKSDDFKDLPDEYANGFLNRMIDDEFTFEVALKHAKNDEPVNYCELVQCILTD